MWSGGIVFKKTMSCRLSKSKVHLNSKKKERKAINLPWIQLSVSRGVWDVYHQKVRDRV
jgi:hypothetical protein